MARFCVCPPAAAITSPDLQACKVKLGQIQRLLFQRKYSSGTTINSFTIASANPNVLASWTPLLGASDGTKVVQTPFVQGIDFSSGEAVTFGGGEDTVDGIETNQGTEPSRFSAFFHNRSQIEIDNMYDLECELLQVFMINSNNQVIGQADDNASATTFRGFDIPDETLFIGDLSPGGRTAPDMNAIIFQLFPRWSRNLYIVTPTDFSPLDNLV